MIKDDLLNRLKDKEDRFVERKSQGVNERELRKELVAFANTLAENERGLIFIGIADKDGKVQGVSNTDELQKRVRRAANDCYPPVDCTCEVLQSEGQDVVVVIIKVSKNRPHFAGQAYVREGSESVKASEKIFNELIDKRHSKCAVILAEKEKGNLIILKKRYTRNPMGIEGYKTYDDCFIVECNTHFVRLTYGGTYMAEPLDKITITRDEKKRKLLLISDNAE